MTYQVPFDFDLLSYDEAVAAAHDTGKISGTTGPMLEVVVEVLDELARPDSHMDVLQIAGTNGKTSTSRFAAAILAGEGKRSALYTSPELVEMRERMEVMGEPVSYGEFAFGVSAALEAGHRVNARRMSAGELPYTVTPFDLLTAAALVAFARAGVEVAVLEVGLGGRWDATSATDPVGVAITGIGLDHVHILGNTLAQIAGEKAAVIKPGRFCVLGEGTHEPSVRAVMEERCRVCGVTPVRSSHRILSAPERLGECVTFSCPGAFGDTYALSMPKPVYQPQNAACAVNLCELYLGRSLNTSALEQSLSCCRTPGRFDLLRADPLLLIDACHNPQSCENFVSALDEVDSSVARRPTLLIAALADKDVSGIVDVLVPAFPRYLVTRTSSDRALPVADMAALVRAKAAELGRAEDAVRTVDTVESALALAQREQLPLVAAGTITLAGEVARELAPSTSPRS